jgi:hypothetical protein
MIVDEDEVGDIQHEAEGGEKRGKWRVAGTGLTWSGSIGVDVAVWG